MSKFKILGSLFSLLLLAIMLVGLGGGQVQAQTEEGQGSLEMSCPFPVQSDVSGSSFNFQIDFKWTGAEPRTFDLSVSGPPRWMIAMLSTSGKQISAIGIQPKQPYPDSISVDFAPLAGDYPDPGEYVMTLTATSGDVTETLELKAIVTALMRFAFYTSNGMLNTKVTAGQENRFSIEVANTGTEPLERIILNSSKPSGWSITFEPTDEITSLDPGLAQVIEAVIKPPRETIAGDYVVSFQASSSGLSQRSFDLRVTVLTPTTLGWVGIIIVLGVIGGLAVLFRRLGRR